MTLSQTSRDYLSAELSRPDPWGLESRAFEHRRLEAMRELVGHDRRWDSGLEIGCAVGAFTEFLAPRCRRLRVVDAIAEAIRRCRQRLGEPPHVTFSVADIGAVRDWGESYDLIVVAEVLYFLGSVERIASAIATIKTWLRPGGTVIFGAALDRVAAQWELPCGAETAMREWGTTLEEVRSVAVRGAQPEEDCLIVEYRSPSAR